MRTKQSFQYAPLIFLLINGLLSGWIREPYQRIAVLVTLLALWTFYCWWSGQERFMLYFYFMLAMTAFGLLAWINPLLPWWIFTGAITVGAVALFVLLHRRAWEIIK